MKKLLYSVSGAGSLLALAATSAYAFVVNPPINVPKDIKIQNVISAVVGILIVVAAILALLYLILGGIQWITSGGDKQGLEGARNKITAAVVGLIIVASTWAIMTLIGQFILFNIFNAPDLPCIADPNGVGCNY